MKRLKSVVAGVVGSVALGGSTAWAQSFAPAKPATSSSQSPEVRSPRPVEIRLLQALRANPATAPYPFSTEPRGSKILLRGRVGARITHDVAIRLAIDLGVPVEDAIVIDTAFNPAGRMANFGTAPGPGPTLTGGIGFGGPPSFGNYGGGGAGGYGGGAGYGAGGGPGAGMSSVMSFPSAGSYGGSPSILPPPIFGRYDDPFYGFDPPAVVYPPWWGGLNAQRVGSNAAYSGNGASNGGNNGLGGAMAGQAQGPAQGVGPYGAISSNAVVNSGQQPPTVGTTETDIGPIPDGTVDMVIDGQGVATIRGGIPSEAEKLAVGQRVSQIQGVAQVVNLLTIKPSLSKLVSSETPPPPPVPTDVVPNGPVATPPPIVSAPRTGAAIPTGARSNPAAIDPTSDSALTDRASRAIADRAATIGAPVQVKVRGGVAQLAGKVASVYEAMLAYRAVQQTPGIRSIDDRLVFEVPDGSNGSNPLIEKGRPDDVEPYLEAQIRRQVGDTAHIDRVRIQADALDLRGTLARTEDRDRFDAILRSMPILRGFQVHSDMPVASP